MTIKAHDLVGKALARHSVDTGFFVMGGPMNGALNSCIAEGLRMIDVRHEQAAAFMAQAYARLRGRPALCAGASGPGTINLTTGLANALVDCAPVLALGGSSPISQNQLGAFQEIDQLAIMRPITKWAERVYDPRRIPEYIGLALRQAVSGRPGPVYLDLPGDVLYADVDEAAVRWSNPDIFAAETARPAMTQAALDKVMALLRGAEKPLLLFGSGILWSGASAELQRFVETAGIPFYATPQARGAVPDDHELSFPRARSTAFREADLVLIVGTRTNYVFGHARPPRFAKTARFVRIDIEPAEIAGDGHLELGVIADAKAALGQLADAFAATRPASYGGWSSRLRQTDQEKLEASEAKLSTDQTPVHPLRLCKEVRDFMPRDAVLVVDGQEILNFGRQSIPTFLPGHRLNSGPFGTMGVGLPFGVGAKAAMPDKPVIVLHGDGSFGLNAMELDTAVRHKLPLLVIISLNGGWTADPDKVKPGRDLGYTRFDKMAEALGCYAEFVERPEDIRPALERAGRAVAEGRVALVNVVTDWRARAQTAEFTAFST